MKRDLIVTLAGVAIVCLIAYGLESTGQLVPPQPTPKAESAAGAPPGAKPQADGNVIMRVNGEPVTDRDFVMFVRGLPEQMQAYAANPAGRRQIADQIVKFKVLEQEARKTGAASDPEVAAAMDAGRAKVYVDFLLAKIAASTTEAQLRAAYQKDKGTFGATNLSHILIAYRGGAMPPRGGQPLSMEQAMQRAKEIETKLRQGAEFAPMAAQASDDQTTAATGGKLGAVPSGALPPEIQAVVDKLQPGEISAPVRSQFGVHIFKLDSRHAQSFEDVKSALQRRLQQERVNEAVGRLQKAARVEYDPKFFDAGKSPQG